MKLRMRLPPVAHWTTGEEYIGLKNLNKEDYNTSCCFFTFIIVLSLAYKRNCVQKNNQFTSLELTISCHYNCQLNIKWEIKDCDVNICSRKRKPRLLISSFANTVKIDLVKRYLFLVMFIHWFIHSFVGLKLLPPG